MNNQTPQRQTVNALVFGGCADGRILTGLDAAAERIQLTERETLLEGVKSLKPPKTDRYTVNLIALVDDGVRNVVGICVVEGGSLVNAMVQLMQTYAAVAKEKREATQQ